MKEWRADESAKKEWDEALAHLDQALKEASIASYTAYISAASLANDAASLADQAVTKQKAGLKSDLEEIITSAKNGKERILDLHGQTLPTALVEHDDELTRCGIEISQISSYHGLIAIKHCATEALGPIKQFEEELGAIAMILTSSKETKGRIASLSWNGFSIPLSVIEDELNRLAMNLHAVQTHEDLVQLRARASVFSTSLDDFAASVVNLNGAMRSVESWKQSCWMQPRWHESKGHSQETSALEHAPRAYADAVGKLEKLGAKLMQAGSFAACALEIPEVRAVSSVYENVVELARRRHKEVGEAEDHNRKVTTDDWGWCAVPAFIVINIVLGMVLGNYGFKEESLWGSLCLSLVLTIPVSKGIGPPIGRALARKARPPKY